MDRYDKIVLRSPWRDERWADDHGALVAAWRAVDISPVPVARFSAGPDAAGHFYFTAAAAAAAGAAGGFMLPRRAFDALNICLKGSAERRVHLKLAVGTELSAATTAEIDRMADTVERLRGGSLAPSGDLQASEPSSGGSAS